MGKQRFTIETLKAGQAKSYAPHVYRYRLTIEGHVDTDDESYSYPIETSQEAARRYAKFFGPWQEPGDPNYPSDAMGQHFSTKLVQLVQIGPGIWEWETTQPYCD